MYSLFFRVWTKGITSIKHVLVLFPRIHAELLSRGILLVRMGFLEGPSTVYSRDAVSLIPAAEVTRLRSEGSS
jgi:hypothetical protein